MMEVKEGGFFMNKEVIYRKPCLVLRCRIGKSILETIRNTPKPDDRKLEEEVQKLESTIKKAKERGTF